MSLYGKYTSTVRNTHGWSVELTCSQCGRSGLPRYEGWMADVKEGGFDSPTVYAKLACPECGRRLSDEAGRNLTALFGELAVPAGNESIVQGFIAGLILVPVLLAALFIIGMQMDWWDWEYGAVSVLLISAASIPVLVMIRNYRIALLRERCDCGKPSYLFMGLLGRTACYRCSSCGNLLRLRD